MRSTNLTLIISLNCKSSCNSSTNGQKYSMRYSMPSIWHRSLGQKDLKKKNARHTFVTVWLLMKANGRSCDRSRALPTKKGLSTPGNAALRTYISQYHQSHERWASKSPVLRVEGVPELLTRPSYLVPGPD